MDSTATTSQHGDPGYPVAPSTIDELRTLVQEQRRRIENLEAASPPLPEATDRTTVGRPAVRVRRPRRVRGAHGGAVSALEAFRDLAPVREDYATVSIMDGFNWADSTARLDAGEWYMVVFRSTRREAADDLTLEMHDYGAYIEAERRAVGLLYYFRGTPNERRECLSFCIWSSRDEAVRAAQLPLHRVAMSMVEEKYEWYTLERYLLRKTEEMGQVEATPITQRAQMAHGATHQTA